MADNIIDQLKLAIFNYPFEKVDITITDFTVVLPGPGLLNAGDVFRYRVEIKNNGCLDMTSVKIHVLATEWAKVSLLQKGPFQETVTSPSFYFIPAFSSYTFGYFYGQAIKVSDPEKKTIVYAHLGQWDASLSYILNSASMEGPSEGTLDQIVYPS